MFQKTLLIFLLTLACGYIAHAQRPNIQYKDRLKDTLVLKDIAERPPRVKKPKQLASEFSMGPTIFSDGYGLTINYARQFGQEYFGSDRYEDFYHNNFAQFEMQERLHPKEFWNFGNSLNAVGTGGGYTYGKVSNLYVARLLAGQRWMLGGHGDNKAVKVQLYYAVGVGATVVKPYMLNTVNNGLVAYDDSMPDAFLDQNNIQGKGGLSKGWDMAKVRIGGTLKFGLHFDFSQKRRGKSAIDIGVSIDYYMKEIRQMATIDPKKGFANIYIGYQIGRRY